MALDLQTLTALWFSQLKSADAGAAVRAALGDGAASVGWWDQQRPAKTPYLVGKAGAIGGQSYDERLLTYTWWIYDEPTQNYRRINRLVTLIEQAYPRTCIPFVETYAANITQEAYDEAQVLRLRTIQFALYTRG